MTGTESRSVRVNIPIIKTSEKRYNLTATSADTQVEPCWNRAQHLFSVWNTLHNPFKILINSLTCL